MTGNAARTRVRVWVFLILGLTVTVLAIVAIGEKSGLFEREATIYTKFKNLDGLTVGAPVRLSGLTIGTVTEVEFPKALTDYDAQVTMSIKARYLPRLRGDSRAMLGSKGLLGDKLIDLSVGTTHTPQLQDGDHLPSIEVQSLSDITSSLSGAAAAIERAASRAESAIDSMINDRMGEDTRRAIAALANLLEAANERPGVLHTLIHDEQAGLDARNLLHELATTARSAGKVVGDTGRLVSRLERGPGAGHDLLFGERGDQIARDLAAASADLSAISAQVRDGDGLAHALVFGADGERLQQDLLAASHSLRNIMATIERGDGTLGGLVVDPTVYEDLKSTLGNIERNVLLKALVRFAISDGDLKRPAIPPPANAPAPAPPAASPQERRP